MLKDLIKTLHELHQREIGCLILTGNRHVFSIGANFSELSDRLLGPVFLDHLTEVSRLLRSYGGLTVSAIDGYALGGGAELALSCDLVLGGPTCQIGFPEVRLGIAPGGGAVVALPGRIGKAKSLELVLSGRTIACTEALSIGLVDLLAESTTAAQFAHEWCRGLPVSGAYHLSKIKALFHESTSRDPRQTERQTILELLANRTY